MLSPLASPPPPPPPPLLPLPSVAATEAATLAWALPLLTAAATPIWPLLSRQQQPGLIVLMSCKIIRNLLLILSKLFFPVKDHAHLLVVTQHI